MHYINQCLEAGRILNYINDIKEKKNYDDSMGIIAPKEAAMIELQLTDRCNLRCVYCRPDNARMLEHSDVLRYEELLDVAKCAVSLGINRFKITGGEPLLRKGSVDFIAILKALEGVEQVT